MDPFDVTNTDAATDAQAAQNGGGSLLDSPSFWRNLQTFGAQTMVAANARTPGGFLQYGSGALGPIGAGILGTMEQNRQNAALQSQLGYQGAQTQNVRQKTAQERIQTAQSLGQYNYLAPFINQPQLDPNGNPIPGSTGVNPLAGGAQQQSQGQPSGAPGQAASSSGGGAGGLAAGVRGIEGGYGTGMNSGGYLGAYQFGTAALTDAGLYKPAPGEDVHANTWKGTISIPGFGDMAPPQFAASPPAQDAAFHITGQRNFSIAQQNGMTNYIGQNVGGVPITPDTLIAGMHFGGVEGTARFLASGGKINPADSNGTTLSNYMLRVANVKQGIQQQAAVMPQQSMDPEQTFALARQVLTSGIPGGMTPEQAGAVAPVLARLPLPGAAETSKRLLDYAMAGRQAASVAQAQGANQAPQGYQRMASGQLMPIPGGPADPAMINMQERAKLRTLRGEGSALIDPMNPQNNVQIPVERTVVDPQTGQKTTVMVEPLEMGKSAGGAPAPQNGPVPLGNQGLVRQPNGNIGTPNGGGLGQPQPATSQQGSLSASSPGVVGSFTSGMPVGREELVKGLGKDYVEESKKEYSSAMMTAGWAEQMDHAMDTLNQGGGWSVTGAGNPERMEMAKLTNSTFQTLGLKAPFDPNKIASWEEFTKQTKTAGMQLVNSMFGGSREAASIINGATSSVPNSENSPIGGKLVLNGIKESSNYVVDRHIFETNWANAHGGSLFGAEEAFNQQYSPAKYAKRAISQVQPYTVDDPSKLKAFLPGTRIMTPGGLKMIPGPAMLPLDNVQ